jgi:hypothetical protein
MNRHRTDTVSLAFGAVFLLIAGWWAIGRTVDIWLPTFGWVLALGLIAAGAVGLIGALRAGSRGRLGSGLDHSEPAALSDDDLA